MDDFSTNLEDGERWIPSDVIHEITSSLSFQPNSKVSNGKPKRKCNIDDGCFKREHIRAVSSLYGAFPPARTPPPITPIAQFIAQGLGERGGGTGVFLPRVVVMKSIEEISNGGGTGVFFHNQKKNIMSVKSKGAFTSNKKKKSNIENGGLTESPYPIEKLLPPDWTY
ncbi:hypothetical protein LWI28_028315 [Acer negundo]|uniref:Uncharacterized protein n=1 Tax=Acer negundo TaxID=4023 RepID=A0AAD5NGK0_ACENE|nr:hypothetical protein LWI28_028315 [Acer negundo]